ETMRSVTITASGGTTANAPVGSYTLTPSAATGGTFTASNYTITYVAGTLTANAAALTITATNRSKTYGATLTLGGSAFTTSGLVNGDTVTSVTLTSAEPAAGAADGTSSLVPSAAVFGLGVASNYSITYTNAKERVEATASTISVTHH